MLVRLPKYNTFFSTQRLEDRYLEWRHKKHHWDIDDDDYTRLDNAVVGLLDGVQTVLYHTVNRFRDRPRKVRVHVDSWDTWNADETLAHIIVPVLEQLRDTTHGSAEVDLEDVPATLHPENFEGEDTGVHERWTYVLNEMIWAFDEIRQDNPGEEQFHSGEADFKFDPVDTDGNPSADSKLYSMEPGPKHTLEIDHDGLTAYYDRIDRGTKLFGKYYRGLWD
mgnify:CR=1 FL=1